MVKLRPLQAKDHERLIAYAFACSEGLTSMPKDRAILEQKLAFSMRCFEKGDILKNERGLFLFVLENDEGLAVGMSAIKTYVGHGNWALSFTSQEQQLNWIELEANLSELCSLYLDPLQRHHLWGKALSYCRFFFIGEHPSFFADKILAQLRGWILPSGDCPFWDEIKKFTGSEQSRRLSFKEAHHLVATGQKSVRDLLPGPLPRLEQFSLSLHPYIGHAHEHTAPAERLLQEIHFHKQHRLDALDAGPHYEKDLLSCPLMSCIRYWELEKEGSSPQASALESVQTLIETSRSNHPCDFELKLVSAKVDIQAGRLLLKQEDLESMTSRQAKALILEPFHHHSSRHS